MVNHYEGKRRGNRDTRRRRTGKQVRINTMLAQNANIFSLVAIMSFFETQPEIHLVRTVKCHSFFHSVLSEIKTYKLFGGQRC